MADRPPDLPRLAVVPPATDVPPEQLKRRGRGRAIERQQKRARILALAAAGASNADIMRTMTAQGMPTTWQAVSQTINAALTEMRTSQEANVEQVRQMQLHRLDTMLTAIWPKVREGNLRAIDRALQIERTRARIAGTEAPQKVEHSGEVAHRIEPAEVDHLQKLWVESGGIEADAVEMTPEQLASGGTT